MTTFTTEMFMRVSAVGAMPTQWKKLSTEDDAKEIWIEVVWAAGLVSTTGLTLMDGSLVASSHLSNITNFTGTLIQQTTLFDGSAGPSIFVGSVSFKYNGKYYGIGVTMPKSEYDTLPAGKQRLHIVVKE
jgi:hypothetical protein